jgi:two-component system response regulator AtoC
LNQYRSEPVQGLESFTLAHVEKNHITRTLSQLGWNKSRAARLLQITLPTLRSKIKRYNIRPM